MNQPQNLLDILGLLYKWRKPIIRLTLAAAIISIIVSLFLPNYYKATTTFYAASPDLSKPEKVFGYSSYDLNYYGTGTDIDRILTIGFATELADFLIDSFDLYNHYDIDTSSKKGRYKVKQTLSDYYKLLKTKYDAIELSVEDKDRIQAANMANAARNKINELAQGLIKRSQKNVINTFKSGLDEKEIFLQMLQDSLINVRKKYGIYDTKNQGEILSTLITETEAQLIESKGKYESLKKLRYISRDTLALINARIQGLEQKYKGLTSSDATSNYNLYKYNEGKGVVESLEQMYQTHFKQISFDKVRYEQMKMTFESDFNALHLVEEAEVPIVKSRPKRAVIVFVATFATFIFTLMFVLIIESNRHVKWKEIFDQ